MWQIHVYGRNGGSLQGAAHECCKTCDVVAYWKSSDGRGDGSWTLSLRGENQAAVTKSRSISGSEDMSEKAQRARKKSKIFACCHNLQLNLKATLFTAGIVTNFPPALQQRLNAQGASRARRQRHDKYGNFGLPTFPIKAAEDGMKRPRGCLFSPVFKMNYLIKIVNPVVMKTNHFSGGLNEVGEPSTLWAGVRSHSRTGNHFRNLSDSPPEL